MMGQDLTIETVINTITETSVNIIVTVEIKKQRRCGI